MFRAYPNMSNRIHDVAVPTQSAKNDLEKSIRIVTSLLYSPLPYSTFLSSTLLNLYPTSPLLLPLPVPLLRFYAALLYSPLLYLFSTLPSSLVYLYSTSTQVPAGHNDLWASENVTS